MDEAPLLEQHENLHKQIKAFDKLLQHAMSKFSAKKMYQVLKHICDIYPDLLDNMSRTRHMIPSMGTLRMIYDRLEVSKLNGLQTEDEQYLMKYLDNFFDDLEYLKDLKKYFDERVYMCLYEYFFDPEVDLDGISFMPDDTNQQELNEILTYRSSEELDFKTMNDKQRLGYAIKDMYYMNRKWDLLYKDEELQSDVFDPDSYHEVVQYPRFIDFEYVFRTVPDVFTKAYKSIEIAKVWWTMANKVYEVLPGANGRKNFSTRELSKRTGELEEKIARLAGEIDKEETLLKEKLADIGSLRSREARCNELQDNCENMEEMRCKTDRKYEDLLEEREIIQRELEEFPEDKDSPRLQDLENALITLDTEILSVHNEFKLLTFHYDLLDEDFQVELQMRPELLRYLGTLELKIDDLEASLEEKKLEQHETKKRLALIRTNCEKMREIMEKYLGSQAALEPDLSKTDSNAVQSNTDDRDHKATTGKVSKSLTKDTENTAPGKAKSTFVHKKERGQKQSRGTQKS